MEGSARQCQGCENLLPVDAHGLRKWCSERCRKSSYWVPCEDCGKPCGGIATQGGGRPPSRFCVKCGLRRAGEMSAERMRPQREMVERMWSEGASCKQIALSLGSTACSAGSLIAKMRARGYDLPVRNVGSARANKGAPGLAAWRKEKAA